MRFFRSVCVAALAASVASAGQVCQLPLERVRLLDGPFKEIQELHRTGLVGRLDPDRLLFPFRKNAGLPQPAGVNGGYGGWDEGFLQGHYGGHYLSAAARMYAATGDTTFKRKADAMVAVLGECQRKLGGGYLSAFPEARLDKLEATPRKGLVEYYTLHKVLAGLVDVAGFCRNTEALEIAEGMSDHIAGRMAKLTPEQVESLLRTDYTGNPVNEFGGMAEALSDLAELSAASGRSDPRRHLRLAAVFCRDWFIDPLVRGENRLNGLHGNTHAAQASALARYAGVSGDSRAAGAADAFWHLVTTRHSFVNGGHGFHEKFRTPGVEVAGDGDALLGPLTSEYCNTYNMLKLTRSLFAREPSVTLADYDEQALFNHILAAIAPDHGKVMYHMPMRPGDYRLHIDAPFCCQGTGIENAARFGEGIYFQRDNHLWVNQYIASSLDWKETGMRLRLETRYPLDGKVRMSLEMSHPTEATLHLRVPTWLDEAPMVHINGGKSDLAARPGSFITLARSWKSGDTIELVLPLGLRVRPSMDNPAVVSFFHGPVVLAGALGRDGMPASDIGGHTDSESWPRHPVPFLIAGSPTGAAESLRPDPTRPLGYLATMRDPRGGQPVEVKLAPFHLVHHQRYALYWDVVSPGEVAAHLDRQAVTRTAAGAFVGDPDAEMSRGFQGERSTTGAFSGRRWRDASDGGWFSYRLPLATGDDQAVVCTYWGGETGKRVFDILVEDTRIATQTLLQNQPGAFFDVTYPIPRELTRGKQFVTIRFQAHPESQAGGLFDVRLNGKNP